MNKEKIENIMIAKKVWKLYMLGANKVAISKELGISRMEVAHIIKYTTQTLYLNYTQEEKGN